MNKSNRSTPFYYFCQWYELVKDSNIPTPKSVIQPIQPTQNTIEFPVDLERFFVRCCNASPKDVCDCVFDIFDDETFVLQTINSSTRTKLDCHVIFREIVNIKHEFRCFWNDGLRAVCSFDYIPTENRNDVERNIVRFFELFRDFPLKSCCIDIAIVKNDENDEKDELLLIEINDFGVGSLASAELYDWEEDYEVLHNSTTVDFRYKKEFEW